MRSRLVLAALVAVVLLAAAVAVPLLQGTGDPTATGGTDVADVVVLADLPGDHVQGDVDYEQSPPAGGPHAGEWLACGVYDRAVRNENAVHSLEHGTVWVTHDPDLGPDQVAALAAALPDESIISPYEGLPSPVVVTVWERQLSLTGVGDPGLAAFLTEYGDGGTAPEPLASCEGGVEAYESEVLSA